VSRYLDLFLNFVSVYNSVMKSVYILAKAVIVFLMYGKFKETRQKEEDSFRIEILVVPCAVLAMVINHEFSVFEVLWTFSIYLESVCIIPQLYMIKQMGTLSGDQLIYLLLLGSYRALYILNWVYRYDNEGFWDVIADISGGVQTSIYAMAFLGMLSQKHWYDQVKKNIDIGWNFIISCGTKTDENNDDDCWLIAENGKRPEKDKSSSLAPMIQKLNLDLVPGADMGIAKSQKSKMLA
jgi:ER lumen protein retaining receptor